MIDLSGRTALVTGGAGGIGFGIAEILVSAGARVAINDLDTEAAGTAAARLGGQAFAVPGDVSDEQIARAVVGQVDAEGFDILVNNAGISEMPTPIDRQDVAEWDRVMAVNLRASYLMSREFARVMKPRRRGVIVNIASIAGMGGMPASHAYGVSKAGLVMLTKTLATELARYGIRANAIAPGAIEAPLLDKITAEGKFLSAVVGRIPMGRIGAPTDIGNAVAFLVSDLARYITGAVLPVDGGWISFAGAGAASR
ncbi:MAG: SDR family oxidoreductase [Sphingopyxis sp.]|nr:SDR family oxidoreductase [Sphingopyxis sp.]